MTIGRQSFGPGGMGAPRKDEGVRRKETFKNSDIDRKIGAIDAMYSKPIEGRDWLVIRTSSIGFQVVMEIIVGRGEIVDAWVKGRKVLEEFRGGDQRGVNLIEGRGFLKKVQDFSGGNEHEGVMNEERLGQRVTGVGRGISSDISGGKTSVDKSGEVIIVLMEESEFLRFHEHDG